MKKCSRCKQEKPLDEFNRRGNGYQSACRQCNREYYRDYYKNNPKEKERILKKNRQRRIKVRGWVEGAKSVPCADCNVEYPPYIMQFDHLGYEEKLFAISGAWNTQTLEKIVNEMAKCEVVCANCHAERTYQRRNNG